MPARGGEPLSLPVGCHWQCAQAQARPGRRLSPQACASRPGLESESESQSVGQGPDSDARAYMAWLPRSSCATVSFENHLSDKASESIELRWN